MMKSENIEKGLMAIALDDENILRFGRMKYDGSRRQWMPDCSLNFGDFVSFLTKKEAVVAASKMSFPAHHVEKIGSRFCSAWGIRSDVREKYFLARYE